MNFLRSLTLLVCLPSIGFSLELGDVNGDGQVSLLDVGPFVDVLISGDYQPEADINRDGLVDLLDVQPFVDLLSGGSTNPEFAPLFDETTDLEPETQYETEEALITTIGDRVRDRHAREDQFQAYDHYLSFYWEERTVSIEIVDRIARGGDDITVTVTSLAPLGTRDFRAFYRGLNTVAEYFYNVGMTNLGSNRYTTSFSFNAKAGRSIQIGDRMEFEFSPFLAAPMNGRTNYYGTAFLYIVGEGLVPWEAVGPIQDSFPIPELARQGGFATTHFQYSNEPDNLLKQMAGNMAPINAQPFVLGRRIHHTHFGNGTHSEQPNPVFNEQAGKLGPLYSATSCVQCHVNNGRAGLASANQALTGSVVRIGIDDCGTPDPTYGAELQPFATAGGGEGTVAIDRFEITKGQFTDGSPFQLQRPIYRFNGLQPDFYSVRIAPQLVGMGLLEAIDESTILELEDPNDDDNDGISGRARFVIDPETGQNRLGRFDYKASKPKLSHQIAAALNSDLGVTTDIFPEFDDQSQATGVELDEQELDYLTRYVALLGVHAQRDYDDPTIISGGSLFQSAGCATCHTPNLTTGPFHPLAELRNQEISPYTDLLLHDMGPGLADNMGESGASGSEWRTTPLWNIGLAEDVNSDAGYLHDGRARNLSEAILWHGGEAEASKEAFRQMSATDRQSLIEFLKSL